MKKTHYYLVDTSGIIPGAAVSELQFNIIDEEPFTVQDLKVIIVHLGLKWKSLTLWYMSFWTGFINWCPKLAVNSSRVVKQQFLKLSFKQQFLKLSTIKSLCGNLYLNYEAEENIQKLKKKVVWRRLFHLDLVRINQDCKDRSRIHLKARIHFDVYSSLKDS